MRRLIALVFTVAMLATLVVVPSAGASKFPPGGSGSCSTYGGFSTFDNNGSSTYTTHYCKNA